MAAVQRGQPNSTNWFGSSTDPMIFESKTAAIGDDTDALGLQAQGDDLALEIVADLLERTDVSHVTSPVVFRARDHRGLDGDLEAEDDRRRTRSGRSAAEDAVEETFLPREEWA
jgi:hypothetical protein